MKKITFIAIFVAVVSLFGLTLSTNDAHAQYYDPYSYLGGYGDPFGGYFDPYLDYGYGNGIYNDFSGLFSNNFGNNFGYNGYFGGYAGYPYVTCVTAGYPCNGYNGYANPYGGGYLGGGGYYGFNGNSYLQSERCWPGLDPQTAWGLGCF